MTEHLGVSPEIPSTIWVDAGDLSIHFSSGGGRVQYKAAKEKPRHKGYKSDAEIEAIIKLASSGLTQKQIASTLGIHPRTVRKFAGRVYGTKQNPAR